MKLTSPVVENGQQLPRKYTKEGENVSPPLQWHDVPDGAQELAIVLENVVPATREAQLQWLCYGIAPQQNGLPEGFKHTAAPEQPLPVRQGRNALGNVGYDGPIGSVGRTFRYRFRLLALDHPSGLDPGADYATFQRAIAGHVRDEAALEVTWERPRP